MSVVTAFLAGTQIATGDREAVMRELKDHLASHDGTILIFEDQSGRVIDLDYRDTAARSVGRPKLGVQAREVTLLPRHWDWLADQSGGASATIRRLVEEARSKGRSERERRDATYRFMQAACGDLPGYEEALRALYAARDDDLYVLVDEWSADIGRYIRVLLDDGVRALGAKPCD